MAAQIPHAALQPVHAVYHANPGPHSRAHLLDLPLDVLILRHLDGALGQLACTCRCTQMLLQMTHRQHGISFTELHHMVGHCY